MGNINIGNSIFPGFNDQNGIMICGYEWGDPKSNGSDSIDTPQKKIAEICTFSNKEPAYGQWIMQVPYDKQIRRWFSLWGHPLNESGLGEGFDKCIVQTNWANTCSNNMNGKYNDLLSDEQVENFIYHIREFKPSILMLMGSKLIWFLQNKLVYDEFVKIVGNAVGEINIIQKQGPERRFKVCFQNFEQCSVICFPHPSGSSGLSHSYISKYKAEIYPLLSNFRKEKGV